MEKLCKLASLPYPEVRMMRGLVAKFLLQGVENSILPLACDSFAFVEGATNQAQAQVRKSLFSFFPLCFASLIYEKSERCTNVYPLPTFFIDFSAYL